MKLLSLLILCLLLATNIGAQSLSWFHGDWTGETYFPDGTITKRIIIKLRIVKMTGNRFDAVLDNLYPNDTTVRLERAITGHIINKELKIESSEQIYILDPRTQNFWRDCTGCEIQSGFSISKNKVEIKIKTVNCGDDCNGETVFSRDTSDLNPAQQRDLAKWFQLPTDKPVVTTDKKQGKDSSVPALQTSVLTSKTDTLQRHNTSVNDPISANKKTGTQSKNVVSKKPGQPDSSLMQKKAKDTLYAAAIKPDKAKKDTLLKPDALKADSLPDALTTRTTNLIKTYKVASPHIVIQLFDNAEIDGDVVTVYHNRQLIANRQSLTHKAVIITIDASKKNAHHEFIMVADNLGLIPPNTALMRITAGEQKFELEVSSDFDNNSKIAIDYTGE